MKSSTFFLNRPRLFQAEGNFGPGILEALDSDSHFTVSVLSRKSSSSSFQPHVQVHQIDHSNPEDELLVALQGQDAFIFLVPPYVVQI